MDADGNGAQARVPVRFAAALPGGGFQRRSTEFWTSARGTAGAGLGVRCGAAPRLSCPDTAQGEAGGPNLRSALGF